MSEIISLINLKGGVGKTVSSINIAYSMAKMGQKVLIVDTDTQGNIATSLGIDADSLEYTLFDLLNEVIDTCYSNAETVKKCIIPIGSVDILPSNSMLAELSYKMMNAQCRETLIREILETVNNDYDHIIIDCPPSLGLIVTNALTASSKVLIPVEAQYLSYESLKVMLGAVEITKRKLNKNLQIAGIFLTKYQSQTKLGQGIRKKVSELYGDEIKVFDEYIPYSIKAAEQTLYGKSLIELAPAHPVSVAYMDIAKELLRCEK